jgi:uroporphyrin-III C-methyltransferase/precorrin-2 dehydrogenase/sirohydrochlorin ferrochelatase
MSRHPALPVSLYVTGRRVVVIGDDETTTRRARRFAAAGALVEQLSWRDYHAERCCGAHVVALQHESEPHPGVAPAERIAADAHAAGCLVYVCDRPELSDLAMPGLATRGPLKLAISSDGVAPALTRRLRELFEQLFADAGPALDRLIDELTARRAQLPRAQRSAELYRIAARVNLRGRLEIDPPDRG